MRGYIYGEIKEKLLETSYAEIWFRWWAPG